VGKNRAKVSIGSKIGGPPPAQGTESESCQYLKGGGQSKKTGETGTYHGLKKKKAMGRRKLSLGTEKKTLRHFMVGKRAIKPLLKSKFREKKT